MMNEDEGLFRAVSTKKVYEHVVEQITGLILDNSLIPGDKLPPERDLADQLGVGRNAVREAVKTLQERGLLEVVQGSGTFVRRMNPDVVSDLLALYLKTNSQFDQIMDLLEVREILDVEIAGRLARTIKDVELQPLWQSLERMQGLTGEELAKEDFRFHVEFYRVAGNKIIQLLMQPILIILSQNVDTSYAVPGTYTSPHASHREMIKRIADGDVEGARSAAAGIVADGKRRLLAGQSADAA